MAQDAPDFCRILLVPRPRQCCDRGMALAAKFPMEFICRHCNDICDGDAYRVKSEEDGVVLLDMIVCYSCSQEARGLELWTQKIDLPVENVQHVFH